MTIVFEGTYSTYQQHDFGKNIKSFLEAPGCERDNLAIIVHSLPTVLSEKDKKSMVKDIRKLAAGVFVTGLSVDYYASFAQGWGDFVKDVDAWLDTFVFENLAETRMESVRIDEFMMAD